MVAREQPQPEILNDVGVLILVDEDIAQPVLILAQDFLVLAKQPQAFEQEIAEVDRVERLQPLLVGLVQRRPRAIGEGGGLGGGHMRGIEPAVLPAVDLPGERARRPALLVDVLRLQDLLEQPELVVRVEDREIGLEAHELGVTAQDLGADGMEGAHPGHAVEGAGQRLDSLAHLARGLVGEGDGEDLVSARFSRRDQMRDSRRQHARLADPGAREHQHRPVERLHRAALLRVQPGEVARFGQPARARGDAGPRRRDLEGGIGRLERVRGI